MQVEPQNQQYMEQQLASRRRRLEELRAQSGLQKPVNDKPPVVQPKVRRGVGAGTVVALTLLSTLAGLVGGMFGSNYLSKLGLDENLNIVNTGGQSSEVRTVTQELSTVQVIDESSAVIDIAQEASDSVVSIIVSSDGQNSIFGISGIVSAGTGFIVSEEGYVITNRHVVEGSANEFTVVFNDDTTATAELLDMDEVLDIAILKVDPNSVNTNLTPLKLGDSDSIQVGQVAIAIGNSLGEFKNSVSKGIISGLDRTIIAADDFGQNPEQLENIIQTDASINSGNSGGPLLDIAGNVIAVNVAKADGGENVGFSIPINSVKPIYESVVANGRIIRPYIGVVYQELNSVLAGQLGLNVDYGAYVVEPDGVVANSPASSVDIRPGDVILSVNGVELRDTSLQREVIKNQVGDNVQLQIQRGDNVLSVELQLDELE